MPGYQSYKNARDAAWQFLIDNRVTELPLKFSDICRSMGISLDQYRGKRFFEQDERGMSYRKDGVYHILLKGTDDRRVQRYTIGHELGHIYLGHLSGGGAHTRLTGTRSEPRARREYEAERFAMGILAPACVLWGLGVRTAGDIVQLCDISLEDARYRAERMRMLYKRERFLTKDLEKQVYAQFEDYIKSTVAASREE